MAWKRTSSAALLACLLCGRAAALERVEAVEPHMGTLFRIVLYAPDAEAARQAFAAAFRRVAELDAALSDYQPDSELNRVCREAWRAPAPVSADLFAVLEESQRVAAETGGAFDVTLGPVIRLWRQARRNGRLPDPGALAAAARHAGYRKLVLDPARRTVFLLDAQMQLDVGGIAKGYAADPALAVLRERGISRALVAASGDLAIGDPPPGKDGWRIGLEPAGRVVTLCRAAVSTSGDTEQYVEIGGVRYSHIVDPKTGLGLTDRIAVSVVSDRGIRSDSLATALSVLGSARALAFAEQHRLAIVVTTPAGTTASPDFQEWPRGAAAPSR